MPFTRLIAAFPSCPVRMSLPIALGGKRPFYLLDLIMGEETRPGSLDIKAWHRALDKAKWQDDKRLNLAESKSLDNMERG